MYIDPTWKICGNICNKIVYLAVNHPNILCAKFYIDPTKNICDTICDRIGYLVVNH